MSDTELKAAGGPVSVEPEGSASGRQSRTLLLAGLRDLALVPAIIVIAIVGYLINPVFLKSDNLINILQTMSEIGLLVLAQTLVLVVGLVNGLLIVRFKLHGFVVTLGMLIVLRGLLTGISGGQTFFGLPNSMLYLGTTLWLGVPVSVYLCFLMFAIGIVTLGYTRIG